MQDFRESVRFALFHTGLEEWLYATEGGTLFLVNYGGKIYGVTCKHVLGSFLPEQLAITDIKFAQKGAKLASVKGVYFPTAPSQEAVGTDITDLCIIDFQDEIDAAFFKGTPYTVDITTSRTTNEGHRLIVSGTLKEKSDLTAPNIEAGFCLLEFTDAGVTPFDPLLRIGKAKYETDKLNFKSVTGISGAPVYNDTVKALCGMIVRGTLHQDGSCIVYYLDFYDIGQALDAAHTEKSHVTYSKGVETTKTAKIKS